MGLQGWMAGILDWHTASGRYPEPALRRRYPKKPQRLGGPTGLGTSATLLSGLRSPEEVVASPATGEAAPVSVLAALPVSLLDRLATGPTGLGTSAAGLLRPSTAAVTSTPTDDELSERELYCPPAGRDDRALGEEVNATRLTDWTDQVGTYPGQLDRLHKASIGRLMMIAHSVSGRHLGLARW